VAGLIKVIFPKLRFSFYFILFTSKAGTIHKPVSLQEEEKILILLLCMVSQGSTMKKSNQILVVLISIFLALSFVFYSQFASYAASSVDDWPIFRHDAGHTGFSSGKAPNSSVVQLWNSTIDTGSLSAPASPVVADGLVYVGSADCNIYCFDGSSGAKVWSFATGGETHSAPAVIDGRVYVGSGDGYVYCLDASTGTQVWNHSVGVSVNSPMNFVDDRIYVESETGVVYCLAAVNGEILWSFPTGAEADRLSPAISEGYVFATNHNGDVFCLNATSGIRVWNFTVGDAVGSPVAVDDFVYFGSMDGNAYCLNASSGAKIWNYTTWYNSAGPAHGYHWGNSVSAPAVAYGRVYVGSSDFDVFCLDALTGEKIWNFSTGAGVYAPPTVAGGCVFAGSYDGNVYCLNASSGAEIWRSAAGVFSPVNAGGSAGSPVVADGVVYVVGNGVLSAWGSPSSGPTFPWFLVISVVSLVIIAAAIVVYLYSRRS
jgi:outer membrane protein assembly factor BamB